MQLLILKNNSADFREEVNKKLNEGYKIIPQTFHISLVYMENLAKLESRYAVVIEKE